VTSTARRLGFGLSLLVHLGLLAGLWLWQQQPVRAVAVAGEVVPVQLAMFAEAPPAATPAAAPVVPPAEAEAPVEAPVERPVEQVAEVSPEPPPPPLKPTPAPRPRPVERPRPPSKPLPLPVAANAQSVAESPVAAVAPVSAKAQAAPAAAPRTAQRVAVREAYKAALLAAIERHKFYPSRARRRGIEGQARVGFRIAADGHIEQVELVVGSGVALLDQAAMQTLQRLGRVAPLPPELGMRHWDLVVPIDFRLL